jgi:hypothetical protein
MSAAGTPARWGHFGAFLSSKTLEITRELADFGDLTGDLVRVKLRAGGSFPYVSLRRRSKLGSRVLADILLDADRVHVWQAFQQRSALSVP